MDMHKRTWRLYQAQCWKVAYLADRFRVSKPTIYDALKQVRLQGLVPHDRHLLR
jgi:predicted DNA-binding protein YlxM (UPF0122 family)